MEVSKREDQIIEAFCNRLKEGEYEPAANPFLELDEDILVLSDNSGLRYVGPGKWALSLYFQLRLMHTVVFGGFDGWSMVLDFITGETVEVRVKGARVVSQPLPDAAFKARLSAPVKSDAT